jgi:hypothetical protein
LLRSKEKLIVWLEIWLEYWIFYYLSVLFKTLCRNWLKLNCHWRGSYLLLSWSLFWRRKFWFFDTHFLIAFLFIYILFWCLICSPRNRLSIFKSLKLKFLIEFRFIVIFLANNFNLLLWKINEILRWFSELFKVLNTKELF